MFDEWYQATFATLPTMDTREFSGKMKKQLNRNRMKELGHGRGKTTYEIDLTD